MPADEAPVFGLVLGFALVAGVGLGAGALLEGAGV